MTKLEKLKSVFIKDDNMRLFEEHADREELVGGIYLPNINEKLVVIIRLPEENINNNIIVMLARLQPSKLKSALYLANQFNNKSNGPCLIVEEGNTRMDDIFMLYRYTYALPIEDFNADIFNAILLGLLKEIDEGDLIKEVKRLQWS